MKKAFLVFSLCLVLALAGLTAVVVTLHDSRDDVEVTLTTRVGDPIHAQGLTAHQQVRYSDNLLWDLTIPLDDPAGINTRYTFSARDMEWNSFAEDPLNLSTHISSYHFLDGPNTTFTEKMVQYEPAFVPLLPLLNDMADRTAPGQTTTETIHPGDYMDTFPYWVYCNLPDTILRYDKTLSEHNDQEERIPRFFQEAFPLDFPEDEIWTVTVKKRDTGYLEEVSYDSGGITGQLYLISTNSDQALYLALSQDTWPQPDYSRFPQGNGVYRMDIVQEEETSYLEVQTLTNIFPLPNEAVVLDLTLDGAENLLVTWYLDGDYRCTILDTETLEPLDTISLFRQERSEAEVIVYDSITEKEYSYPTWVYEPIQTLPGEDFLLFLGGQQFWFFLQTEEGWQEQCSAPLTEELWYTSTLRMDAAWNGETLAIGSADGWVSGLDLWVYDDTGDLLFNGHYDTSLTDGPNTEGYNHRSNVFPMEGKELELRWK